MKVTLKKAIRKPDHTKRYVWFNTFPHLPLTKKPKGMRMGKGVGKLNAWQTQLRGNSFIFEFKNLRPGRAVKFFKKLRVKFPVPTLFF
jgi:ribosomal protein L16/L10AE